MSEREAYLGDGLYASWDGWQVKLRAPREGGDHEVFIEDGLTLQEFLKFLETLPIKRPSWSDHSGRSKMKYLVAIAMTILIASSSAQAGSCQDAIDSLNKDLAADKLLDPDNWAPGAKEANDKLHNRERTNILQGCMPGGFYDQLDQTIKDIRATCKAHPDLQGCWAALPPAKWKKPPL
jgi:hypothetical protein